MNAPRGLNKGEKMNIRNFTKKIFNNVIDTIKYFLSSKEEKEKIKKKKQRAKDVDEFFAIIDRQIKEKEEGLQNTIRDRNLSSNKNSSRFLNQLQAFIDDFLEVYQDSSGEFRWFGGADYLQYQELQIVWMRFDLDRMDSDPEFDKHFKFLKMGIEQDSIPVANIGDEIIDCHDSNEIDKLSKYIQAAYSRYLKDEYK